MPRTTRPQHGPDTYHAGISQADCEETFAVCPWLREAQADSVTCRQPLYATGEPCGRPATVQGFDTAGRRIGRCKRHAKPAYGFLASNPAVEPRKALQLYNVEYATASHKYATITVEAADAADAEHIAESFEAELIDWARARRIA